MVCRSAECRCSEKLVDAAGAAEHIKNLKLNGFDREAYIARHREVLFKYSLNLIQSLVRGIHISPYKLNFPIKISPFYQNV